MSSATKLVRFQYIEPGGLARHPPVNHKSLCNMAEGQADLTKMKLQAVGPETTLTTIGKTQGRIRMQEDMIIVVLGVLDDDQGPKEMLAASVSTNFPSDESLAQILHHRFCIAVHRLLCYCMFCKSLGLRWREGNASRITATHLLRATGWWL